jgi:hypothetical protein
LNEVPFGGLPSPTPAPSRFEPPGFFDFAIINLLGTMSKRNPNMGFKYAQTTPPTFELTIKVISET